jgi:cation-transporting ATPase 13A1
MSVADGHDEHGSRQQRMSAEDALNAHDAILKKRIEEVNALRIAHMKEFQARYQRESQAALQLRVKELTERGEYMKTFSLMKDQAVSMKNTIAAENERFMRAHGHVWDPIKGDDTSGDSGTAGGLASLLAGIDTGDALGGAGGNSAPVVRPGDASVAAPFTSRVPSVRAVVDLIRQGRCTLLSALMHQQIMMLESIIAAYTLSALSLHNARSSERQMMASSWLIMTAAVAFSYSSPLDHMHPERPIRSLFHPAIFISMLGQAGEFLYCQLIFL